MTIPNSQNLINPRNSEEKSQESSLQILTSSSLIPAISKLELILPQKEVEQSLAKSEFEIDKLWRNNENLNQKLMRNALENGAKLVFEKDINGTELPFVEFENAQDLYNFLDKFKEIGGFFHGSSLVIKTLEPRKAKCSIKKEGNQNAIFFARDWTVPFFCGICPKNGKRFNSVNTFFNPKTGKMEIDAQNSRFSFDGKLAENGYLYLTFGGLVEVRHDNGKPANEFVSNRPLALNLRIVKNQEILISFGINLINNLIFEAKSENQKAKKIVN